MVNPIFFVISYCSWFIYSNDNFYETRASMKKYLSHIILFFIVFLTFIKVVSVPSFFDQHLGTLPVMHDGRVKPFDSIARHYLLQLKGKRVLRKCS